MFRVDYLHEFNYREFPEGQSPVLQLEISLPNNPQATIDVDAYLDSGAQRSLFNGFLITGLGAELSNERVQWFSSTAGDFVKAYFHSVRIGLPGVGNFDLDVCFTETAVRRNLLGRDFFNLAQIGFRESQRKYYLIPSP